MRSQLFLPIAVTLGLAGCQTATDALSTSAAPADVTGPAAGAIAGDLAGRFFEQAGAPSTPIRLHTDSSDFAVALKAALKGWGYTVVTDDKSADTKDAGAKDAQKPVELAYSLAAADGEVFARLSTDTMALARAYSVTNGVATPASPLSLMRN